MDNLLAHAAGRQDVELVRGADRGRREPVVRIDEGPGDKVGFFDEIYETLCARYQPDNLLLASLAAGRLLERRVTT